MAQTSGMGVRFDVLFTQYRWLNTPSGDFYGSPESNSLHLLRSYFTRYPEDSKRVVLSIKTAFSRESMTPDCSPEGIRRSIDNCLAILDGKVFIDILEPARVDPKVPIETTVAAISEYVKAGKIGGVGLSECSAATLRKAHAVYPIQGIEREFSLFTTDPLTNGLVETCAELEIPLIGHSPLSHGFLSGSIRKPEDIPEDNPMLKIMPRYQLEVFGENLKLVDEVKALADRKGATVAQVAINWSRVIGSRYKGLVVIPLPGATSVQRVEENLKILDLTNEDLDRIQQILDCLPIQGSRYPEHLLKMSDL